LLILGVLYGFKNIPEKLGLNKGVIIGFLFSIITVLPMIVSSAIIGHIGDNLDFGTLLHNTFIAGFFEEYFFRGFLFGILFRKLKWGFIPASILGGVIFGLGHIYQGSTLIETTGIFAITTIGAVWFSWLYIEWEKNLWIPIFLHTLMNLSWILFEVSDNALGGVYTNLFRVITIALTIIITILYHKKRGLNINRKNLIINNS
jgi:membrane protease YdiL (CAAX protease family)